MQYASREGMPETNDVGNWLAHRIPNGSYVDPGRALQRFFIYVFVLFMGLGIYELLVPHEHNPPSYKNAAWTLEDRHTERQEMLLRSHREWHAHDSEFHE